MPPENRPPADSADFEAVVFQELFSEPRSPASPQTATWTSGRVPASSDDAAEPSGASMPPSDVSLEQPLASDEKGPAERSATPAHVESPQHLGEASSNGLPPKPGAVRGEEHVQPAAPSRAMADGEDFDMRWELASQARSRRRFAKLAIIGVCCVALLLLALWGLLTLGPL